jgi:hypothetical protein
LFEVREPLLDEVGARKIADRTLRGLLHPSIDARRA